MTAFNPRASRFVVPARFLLPMLCWAMVHSVTMVAGEPPAGGSSSQGLALRQDRHGLTIEVAGRPFAAYVIDEANKPYLWPVFGPTGKAMTRAYPMQDLPEEPNAQRDHPHHRGILFGHESISDANTWHERATFEKADTNEEAAERRRRRLAGLGSIVHREFSLLAIDGERAVVEEICDHLDPAGKPLLVERRRLTFRAEQATRSIDIDQEFSPPPGSATVVFGDHKDAGLLVRVPTSMAVDEKQGGRIVNSEGQANADAWSQPARWCDYHGPVAGEQLGIAILNHPSSYRHPTRWHVRTYGLFAANPFASRGYDPALPDGTTALAAGEVLRLHHRFLLHSGDERAAAIDEAWQRYAGETPALFRADR
jgi:Methane oxygenase PmoA